jgi:predicted amidohydrolase
MKKSISILCLFLFISFSVNAKNHVKIATIGAVSPNLDLNNKPQKLVEQMIDFWEAELANVLPDKPDLIVLPEVCDRPAGMDEETKLNYYKTRNNQILDYFASVAKKNNCYIIYGAMRLLEDGSWRNSAIILDRKGSVSGIYDKNFPTIGGMEGGTKAANDAPVFQCDFGTVACAVCFDLNFDELRLRYAAQNPDLIVFPSLYHGGLVQANWAYSCRAFFVGSIGIRNLPSQIRNPMGKVVATSTNYFHFIVSTVNLDYCIAHLDNNWAKLRAMKKRYGEDVVISDPGEIGAVLITSESENITAKEMAKEFEILLLDDYLNNSREFRHKPGMME